MNSTVKTVVFWLVIVLSAVLLWEVGNAHIASGDLRGADADFTQALEADATLLPALRAQARLREATGEERAGPLPQSGPEPEPERRPARPEPLVPSATLARLLRAA